MPASEPERSYRFGTFEAETATGELRRQGIRMRLHAQPFQLLLMLLERPGELVTREQISERLWPDGTFVDYEHGVNSAVNRIREALGDSAAHPRFIETLARRGYRFIAPVERIEANGAAIGPKAEGDEPEEPARKRAAGFGRGILTTPVELPKISQPVVRALFILFQLMYLGFYVGALANLGEIEDLLSPLAWGAQVDAAVIATAGILIPVRAFLICAVLFRAPGFRGKFLKLWVLLLVADVVWALSPFLLLHHINFGLALASMALLVYSPFVQRSLVLMGAGEAKLPVV